ncbi:MAG: ABC transporter substrate-binding protein [Alicyclobacillaceae bacterium]|nr:ABC transporter substrate-binding protein [Alicyclobacillaceae bacterium]
MNKMRIFGMWTAVLMAVTALAGCGAPTGPGGAAGGGTSVKKIGIIQIVDHPALNEARDGFIQALADAGYKEGEKVVFDRQNAQNDQTTAKTIADKFVRDKVDLILAVSTSAAQAVYNTTKSIPIVITAVTNPVSAGLVQSMDKPGTNVTGTSDAMPIAEHFKLIQEVLPNAKRIGFLYNPGETNSSEQFKEAQGAAPQFGFTLVPGAVSGVNEVKTATAQLADKVDAIYVPTDNTVVSAIATVVQTAKEKKIPVFGSEEGQVKQGALITKGIDYHKLGYQAGQIAVRILKGEDPKSIPIETAREMNVVVNLKTAQELGIRIPDALLQKAKKIE